MIDWNRVNELRSEVGEDSFEEVVELFLEEVEEVLARLKRDPDPTSFEEDMHFLKGSALSLGFQDVSDICQSGEQTAAGGNSDQIDLSVLFACYDASKVTFLKSAGVEIAA